MGEERSSEGSGCACPVRAAVRQVCLLPYGPQWKPWVDFFFFPFSFVLGWTMFPVKGFQIPKYPSPCPKRDVDGLGCLVHHVFVAAYASTDSMGLETPVP